MTQPPRCQIIFALALLALAQISGTSLIADDVGEPERIQVRVVDEAGDTVAGAIVEFRGYNEASSEAVSNADGIAVLDWVENADTLLARSADGDQLGYRIHYVEGTESEEAEITLKPARTIDVQALFMGQPVIDATVEVHVRFRPIAEGATDANGRCRLSIPQDAVIHGMMVYKSEVGFAGFYRGNAYFTLQRDEGPNEYQFNLSPTGSITVRVVDRARQPVAGIEVYPWLVQPTGGVETLNIAAARSLHVMTDENGEAVFDMFPENVKYVAFGARENDDYYPLSNVYWRPELAGNMVTLEVWPLIAFSGRVLGIDGAPADGVTVQITGSGPDHSSVRRTDVTDNDGKYEFRVPPDHVYIIGVDGSVAARSLSGFTLPEEGTLEGMDLQLIEGTPFRGTVRNDDGSELEAQSLIVIENAAAQERTINGQLQYFQAQLSRTAGIDEAGNFQILLGPGDYYAYSPGGNVLRPEFFRFQVAGQAEITHDFVIETVHTAELTGRVVREVDGTIEPVANVTVTGVQIDPQAYPDPASISDEEGGFVMTWQPGTMLLHAMTEDGAWGMTHMLQGEPEDFEIILQPTSSATGQILSDGLPLPGFKFNCEIQVDYGDGSSTNRFGGQVETDDEGRFTIEGLIQGQRYWCSHHLGHSYYNVADVTAADATPLDLGQIEFDSNNRAPTPIERMRQAFVAGAEPRQRLDAALAEAAFHQQHVLVVVGDTNHAAVRNLFRLFFEEFDFWDERSQSPLKPRLHNFELCGLGGGELGNAAAFPTEIASAAGSESPALFVLDASGNVLGTLSSEDFVATDATLDESAIFELLEAHQPPVIDVESLLEEVLVEAAATDPPRLILVHEVDTQLAKSRRLSQFFARHADSLGEHFVYFPVDPMRMAQGYELLDALASDQYSNERGQGRGSSWVGIMSADGELLGSMKFEGNSSTVNSREIDELFALIREHAPNIDAETLTDWRDAFLATEPYESE